jgi:uncharacterized membrane protein YphA (DoxX/SURF4 family)
LRLAFCYWLLFCIPVLTTQVLGLDWTGKLISPLWDAMVVWVGQHALAIADPIQTADNGSGDRLGNWIFLACIAVISLVVALVWAIADRRRPRDARLRELLRVLLRYTLAFVLFGYGVDKVFLAQFPAPNIGRLLQPYGDSSPMGLMWTFMGASPAYQLFSGAMEVLGALLLLFRRTTTLGALVLGAVLTNIVLLNFCYDVPVKINSSHYLAMCGFLLLPELRRLTDVLVRHRPTQPALQALVLPRRWMRVARRVLKYGSIAVLLALNVKTAAGYRETPPATWYEGYWSVTAFARDGQDVPPLITDATRWKRIRFQVAGTRRYFRWRGMDDSYGDLYTFTIDEIARTIAFVPDPDRPAGEPKGSRGPFTLTYTRLDDRHLQLEGKIGTENLRVRLERFDASKMLLVSRGFHWVNEEPFNR